jgi:hypothetical protein
MSAGRVTGFGEFFAYVAIVGIFKNYKSTPNLLPLYYHGKKHVLILKKLGWATFWAIFSQTHLVTLPAVRR